WPGRTSAAISVVRGARPGVPVPRVWVPVSVQPTLVKAPTRSATAERIAREGPRPGGRRARGIDPSARAARARRRGREGRAVVAGAEIRDVAVHGDRGREVGGAPAAALDADGRDAGADRRRDVVRRVTEEDRLRGRDAEPLEGGDDDVGI